MTTNLEVAPKKKRHCVVCRGSLTDCEPREYDRGIHDYCADSGFNRRVPGESKIRARALVVQLSEGVTFTEMQAIHTELFMLGYEKLVGVIAPKNATITIMDFGVDRILVKAPFTEGGLEAMKSVPGRKAEFRTTNRLGAAEKRFVGNSFPKDQKRAVWAMLKRTFPGALGVGPQGPFTVPVNDSPSPEEIERQETAREARKEAMAEQSEDRRPCLDEDRHDGEECTCYPRYAPPPGTYAHTARALVQSGLMSGEEADRWKDEMKEVDW